MGDEVDARPAVVLGAGYAGLTACHAIRRAAGAKIPLRLIDRHPFHVLRTELYEIGRMAAAKDDLARWAIPMQELIERQAVEYTSGTVESIDLASQTVSVSGERIPYRSLAICLGSVAAYYGVPGAAEHTLEVYRLNGARALAKRLTEVEAASVHFPAGRRPKVVVVGGGSTGTEVAADIATARWERIAGAGAKPTQVFLVVGALPLLAGLPEGLIAHARRLLRAAGVVLLEGANVRRVDAETVSLEDGTVLPYDAAVWCAGLQAPDLVRALPVPHGHSGRLRVTPELELPGHPGVFAVGDVIEFEDPRSKLLVPATAQAALAEARVAGRNLAARWMGSPLLPFEYRERTSIVQVGAGRAAGAIRRWTLWGRPASLLKSLVQREYAFVTEHGRAPPGL